MNKPFVLGLFVVVVASGGLAAYGFSAPAKAAKDLSKPGPSVGAEVAHRAAATSDSLVGVFEGRTPCGPIATEFTGFPAQNCEKIKWRLTLYRDPATGQPTAYVFDGTRTTRRGRWRIEGGTGSERSHAVYHLSYEGVGRGLSLLSIDENVLLLLDRDLKVLVGDASWSYALNRVSRPVR